MKRPLRLVALLSALIPLVGCAPNRLAEGIGFAADRYQVRDASALRVAGRGHLRFDIALRSDLDDAIAAADLAEVVRDGTDVLERAHELAVDGVNSELDRMNVDGLNDLIKSYELLNAPADEAGKRAALQQAYASESREALDRDFASLQACKDVRQARSFLEDIRRNLEPPAGDQGKLGRILLAAPLFLPATVGAEIADAEAMQRAVVSDFEQVVVYRPPNTAGVDSVANLESAAPATLARWFAPILVQQIDPAAEYAPEDDRIGRVFLSGDPDHISVNVDVGDPVVYWTHGHAKVGDRRYDQLTYVAWYPRRPALEPNDASAGRIDGVVLRITLDSHERPAIYEFVRSCGCYHTLWVAEYLEAQARAEFGPPAGDLRYSIQRPVGGRELFLPVLVPDDGASPRRAEAYVCAGHHLLMGVEPGGVKPTSGEAIAERTYRLEPYDTLTHLPLGDGVASMFGSDGLVHNAGRQEGWLLAPTGMLSAGQPRQLGTMKIRMDAYDYDDPRLLERNLRLPDAF